MMPLSIKKIPSYFNPIKLEISFTQQIDFYNLLTGAYSPLTGFCRKNDFLTVTEKMELADGTLWPIPIILDIDDDTTEKLLLSKSDTADLLDENDKKIGYLENIEIYPFDKNAYCKNVFGTLD